MIVDYFPFFAPYGKEMLKLRYELLKDHVDKFVISESNKTHSGSSVDYEFEDFVSQLDIPMDDIIYVKVDIPEDEDLVLEQIDLLNTTENYQHSVNLEREQSKLARVRERYQKNALLEVLDKFPDDTVFIHSDMDEIIRPEAIQYVANTCRANQHAIIKIPLSHHEGSADYRVFWNDGATPVSLSGGMFVATKQQLQQTTPVNIRSNIDCPFPITFITESGKAVEDLGWHFSWMGGKALMKYKSKHWLHHNDNFSWMYFDSFSDPAYVSFIEDYEFKDGVMPPSGNKNYIIKKDDRNKLPQLIYDHKDLYRFFISADVVSVLSSIEDTKKQIIDLYNRYDNMYGVWGWCCLNKAGCLIDYTKDICDRYDNPVTVEIGVYGGKSFMPVALELKRHQKGTAYAIDPWTAEEATKGYEGVHKDFWNQIPLDFFKEMFYGLIDSYQLEKFVQIFQKPSDNVEPPAEIHLLYIDGQHTDQALRDAERFATKVVSGGYCLVDDVKWGEVEKVPSYLENIGFEPIHFVSGALVFQRV